MTQAPTSLTQSEHSKAAAKVQKTHSADNSLSGHNTQLYNTLQLTVSAWGDVSQHLHNRVSTMNLHRSLQQVMKNIIALTKHSSNH